MTLASPIFIFANNCYTTKRSAFPCFFSQHFPAHVAINILYLSMISIMNAKALTLPCCRLCHQSKEERKSPDVIIFLWQQSEMINYRSMVRYTVSQVRFFFSPLLIVLKDSIFPCDIHFGCHCISGYFILKDPKFPAANIPNSQRYIYYHFAYLIALWLVLGVWAKHQETIVVHQNKSIYPEFPTLKLDQFLR